MKSIKNRKIKNWITIALDMEKVYTFLKSFQ